jgi:hypothetical protein
MMDSPSAEIFDEGLEGADRALDDHPASDDALVQRYDWSDAYNWSPSLRLLNVDGRQKIQGRRSDIAQATLYHLGKPLRLDSHAFLLPVYNASDDVVLKCGRQVAKSTTLSVIQVLEAITRPHGRSLYVSPSALQTRQYSNEKLRPTIYGSPWIVANLINKDVIDQVFEKTLSNGSYMFLRYAFLTAARARGIPASLVLFDEIQDLLKDNIKIISQSRSASRVAAGVRGRMILAGTPLTFAGTAEEYWRWSTQNEWFVPCDRHSPRYWNLLGVENIGKRGLICAKPGCGMPIDPTRGKWVMTVPDEVYKGYHVTQLMVPWMQSEEAWRSEIVLPLERWPQGKFYNEVLGLSFDSAGAPVTAVDLQRCCHPVKQIPNLNTSRFTFIRTPSHAGLRCFAGIDWGEGRQEGEIEKGKKRFASWTVLTLGAYVTQDLFWPFYMKRYVGKEIDPELIIPDVLNVCGQFHVEVLGADWGHGWGMNSRLFHARGRDRVMQFAYSTNLGERKRWDKDAYKFIINRNAILSSVFYDIKQERFVFPEWQEFEPFAKDILAEYVEYNERTKTMLYDHPIDQPDDALHSLVYCKLAADITLGRF